MHEVGKDSFSIFGSLVAQGKDIAQRHEKEATGIKRSIKKNKISGKLQMTVCGNIHQTHQGTDRNQTFSTSHK